MQYTGTSSILTLLLQIIFILITFQAIRSFHIEIFFRNPPQGLSIFIVLVSIAIGYLSGSFFAEFFNILHGALNMVH